MSAIKILYGLININFKKLKPALLSLIIFCFLPIENAIASSNELENIAFDPRQVEEEREKFALKAKFLIDNSIKEGSRPSKH